MINLLQLYINEKFSITILFENDSLINFYQVAIVP